MFSYWDCCCLHIKLLDIVIITNNATWSCYYWAICYVCRRKPEPPEETGAPGGNLRCQRESPSLSHEEWVWPGIEPTTSEVTGADVNFEHQSYHCATLTAHVICVIIHCNENKRPRSKRSLVSSCMLQKFQNLYKQYKQIFKIGFILFLETFFFLCNQ
jgi:hypothetical protein